MAHGASGAARTVDRAAGGGQVYCGSDHVAVRHDILRARKGIPDDDVAPDVGLESGKAVARKVVAVDPVARPKYG